jgi:hypothetical protein
MDYIWIILVFVAIFLHVGVCVTIAELYDEKKIETSVSSIFFGFFPIVNLYLFIRYIIIPNMSSLKEIEGKINKNRY